MFYLLAVVKWKETNFSKSVFLKDFYTFLLNDTQKTLNSTCLIHLIYYGYDKKLKTLKHTTVCLTAYEEKRLHTQTHTHTFMCNHTLKTCSLVALAVSWRRTVELRWGGRYSLHCTVSIYQMPVLHIKNKTHS